MKKILFTLLICLFMIPNVNADECTLVASYSSEEYYFKSGSFGNYYLTPVGGSSAINLSLNTNTYYTVYFDNSDSINLNDYTFNFSGSDYLTFIKADYYYQFTSKNIYDANIFTKASLIDWNTLYIYSSTTDTICLPTSEPETPDTPIIPDTTLDDFYSIFIDKISSFANFSIENKFMLCSIGIILLFVILEIILNLFGNRGDR